MVDAARPTSPLEVMSLVDEASALVPLAVVAHPVTSKAPTVAINR